MNRQIFLDRLHRSLRGLPPPMVADILADYGAHFDEGNSAGRNDQDIAAALGDPRRLGRELCAEARFKRWEDERSPAAAAAAATATLGLCAVDLIFVTPMLVLISLLLLMDFISGARYVFFGGLALIFGPFSKHDELLGVIILSGVGTVASGICQACVGVLIAFGVIKSLVWYGRLT